MLDMEDKPTQVTRPMLTPEQIAKRLNISERKAYDLLNNREIVALKVGREWRIEEEDLEAYIERGKRK